MREIGSLTVTYHGQTVGTLAETPERKVAFQYDRKWLQNGFSISPFGLPLTKQVYVPKKDVFDGLFGVFADSLPDGWGRLLVDRMLRRERMEPETVSATMRLAIVGGSGMGALEYDPELFQLETKVRRDFDLLARACEQVLQEKETDDLDLLFKLGGSSGGARPKVLLALDGTDWIVKFPSSYDRKSIGEEEYRYMHCAARCGIEVPGVRLFPSKICGGYFGTRRFDRIGQVKVHMITAGGLLETSHRIPNLDYHDLMKLTFLLTKGNGQMEEMYRRMCFNVYAHNRDDHSKNFSYLYDEAKKKWKLSPAYDLTYSHSIGGEHATTVNGNGRNPGFEDLLEVGMKAGISREKAVRIARDIEEIVQTELADILRSYRVGH